MKRRILILFLIRFAMNIIRCQAGENSAPTFSPIHCSMDCEVVNGKIWSNVTFSNSVEFVIGVFDEKLLKSDRLFWSPFEVSCNGKNIPYTGFLEKRAAPGPNEFYRMKPHEVIKSRVEIGRYYNLTNTGDYIINYFAVNPRFQNVDLFVIQSTPIKFNSGHTNIK